MKALILLLVSAVTALAQWPAPKAPAVPEADGYVEIPNVAFAPTKNNTYRAVFDATRPADKPTALLPDAIPEQRLCLDEFLRCDAAV